MPIKVIPPAQATGRLKEIYDQISAEAGQVPLTLQIMSLKPSLVEAFWKAYKDVYLQSTLSQKQIALIGYEVSKADGCGACQELCTTDLSQMGVSQEEIEALERDIKETKFDDKTKNICIYAYAISADPHNKDSTVAAFKGLGLTDEDILEIATIANRTKATFGTMHSIGFHSMP